MPIVLKNRYVTTAKAAKASGIPARTIRWWHASGKIRGELIDTRRLLVHLDDVLDRAAKAKSALVSQSTA